MVQTRMLMPLPPSSRSPTGPDAAGDALGLAAERAFLVRLCAGLTGDPEAAEDLAQEALLLALRLAPRLRDPTRRGAWLAGIARNLCRHWRRRRGRERARAAAAGDAAGTGAAGLLDVDDLVVELERAELAALLDRALGRLPPETRRVLVERYLEEAPAAAIARRLGLTEGAVAMRLQRGRLALRRVLATELREEAAAYGLVEAGDALRETRIWCPWCGRRRLLGRLGTAAGASDPIAADLATLTLRCPDCCAAPGAHVAEAGGPAQPGVFRGVKGYRAAYSRLLAWTDARIAGGLAGGVVPCWGCGRPARLAVDRAPTGFAAWAVPSVRVRCPACTSGAGYQGTLGGLLLARTEARRFWRAHPRLRLLPIREVEAAGVAALVAGFEAVGSGARWEAVCARDTLAVLAVHGGAAPAVPAAARPPSERVSG